MAFTQPTLLPHQQVAKDFIVSHPHCGIFLGIGGMKTLTTLTALSQIRPTGHILVIAPLSIARSVWLDEIEKWGFPLRTRSLIVDDDDRQLSRQDRVAGFHQVFQDPPTMYFINQDMLTQPSQARNLLVAAMPVPTPGSPVVAPGGLAAQLRDLLTTLGPTASEDLVEAFRDRELDAGAERPTAKSKLATAVKELTSSGFAERRRFDCEKCSGKGCQQCQFGLIDQMPRQRVNGKETIMWPFGTVIIDESQGFKDHTSNRFGSMKRIRPAITRLIELTGTPTPQSLLDIWAQMYLIDQGLTLGAFSQYRAKYFRPTAHIEGRPIKWELLPGAAQEIHQAIAPFVMSAKNTSITLPEPVFNKVNVTLPAKVMKAYKDFARDQVLELGMPDPRDPRRITITAENAAILAGKLVQFASGTIYTSKNKDYAMIHQEKLELTEHLISNSDGNVLVAYRFIAEREQLLTYLRKKGHHVEIFDKSREMVRRWNAGEIEVMIVHPASAGPGLNLQDGGHTLIWHTLPDPLDHYDQLNGRLHRPGQANPVTIHMLLTKGTRDAGAPDRLQKKALVQKGLINAVEIDVFDVLGDEAFDDIGDLDIDPL